MWCLTLREPQLGATCHLGRRIESRTGNPPFRPGDPVALHGGQSVDPEPPFDDPLPNGYVPQHGTIPAVGIFGCVLDDARQLPRGQRRFAVAGRRWWWWRTVHVLPKPVPYTRGHQFPFRLPTEASIAVLRQLPGAGRPEPTPRRLSSQIQRLLMGFGLDGRKARLFAGWCRRHGVNLETAEAHEIQRELTPWMAAGGHHG